MLRFGRVEITGGFLLLMAWLNYCDTQGLLPLGVCAAVVHELGHWATVRLVNGRVSRLRLSAVGAQMQLEGTLSYGRELLCALAGPAVNLLLGYGTAQLGWLVFAGMNVALGMFNLLPVGPLDGGRALRCAVALLGDADAALTVRRWVDGTIAVAMMGLGLGVSGRGGGITLVTVGGWLLLTIAGESVENWRKKDLSRGRGTGKMVCTDFYRLDACCHESNPGTNSAQGTEARPLHRRRI